MLVAAGGGAPHPMTDARNGVTQFAWSPDGATIAFVTADVPKNQAAIDQHHDSFEVGNDSYLTTAAPTSAHLWLVAAARRPGAAPHLRRLDRDRRRLCRAALVVA